jgi:formylglycine-generating enzyme required for sulfatase activity
VNTKDGPYRVLRGGAWSIGANNARCSKRIKSGPDTRSYFLGFRLVRE